MSAALSLLPLLALLAARATPAAPPATVAEHAGAPKPKGIMRVADVRPGMDVIAWTVFTGRKVEPFHGVVLGVARNFFGPRRDVVLVDFDDERVRHTGIVHGMSGSPAYIGDKVLGAVALVLSPFPKDAVAGVTPLEYMLAEGDDIPGGPPPAGGGTAPAPARGGARLMADPPNAIPATAALRPLAAPLVFSGLSPQVFARFRPDFEALGFTPVLGGGGSDPGSDLGPADLQPGACIDDDHLAKVASHGGQPAKPDVSAVAYIEFGRLEER